jgi:flagellar hook protein FlgE
MSLFGSLYTGVSALAAQSQSTAMISNNIANVNTVGFKRSEASFNSLVTTASLGSRYTPGTVSVDRIQRVNQQGPIQQSLSATDISVSGNGFLVVKSDTNNSDTPYAYTRNGQFAEDAQGLLRNSAGFYLHGWPLDENGDLPAAQGDLSSLVPVDVAFLGGLTRPTSQAELSINLNASEKDSTLTGALTSEPDFQRGLRVFDSLGGAQDMRIEFVKTYGPQATVVSTIFDAKLEDEFVDDIGLTDGTRFSISVNGGTARTYEVDVSPTNGTVGGADATVRTLKDLIEDINANLTGAQAFLSKTGELVVQSKEFRGTAPANSINFQNITGTPLTDLGITPGAVTANTLGNATYDNGLSTENPAYSSEGFPSFNNLPGDPNYNSRGWWQVIVRHPDGNPITTGLVNFNSDGSLNARPDVTGKKDIELNNIDWKNGSAPQDISIDIERFSQFSGDYNVIFSDQNGAELGLRTGVEIDEDGFVVARFSNGASAQLYKIPLVTFANPNGLQEISGTAYVETEVSGEENLREAGRGGSGRIETSTLENSNVDLADEFSKLIIGQRAYSAGTKVINTIDQMTEELLRLR